VSKKAKYLQTELVLDLSLSRNSVLFVFQILNMSHVEAF